MSSQLKGLLASATLLITSSTLSTVIAAEPPPACSGGTCPGLGHAFFLPNINVQDASQQTGNKRVLLNTAVGTCSTVAKSGSSSKDFQEFASSQAVTDSMSAGFNAGGNTGGLLGAFTLTATAEATMARSLEANESYNSVNLNYYLLDSIVDINRDSNCWSVKNLDPEFLANFEGLPLQAPEFAAEGSSWADYRFFLQETGSHIQVKQELGSRYSNWQSMTASDKLETSVLKAKVCFNLGYAGASLPACGDYTNQQKLEASTKNTVEKLYVAGGTKATRDALLSKPAGQLDQASLDAFIASAASGDQAIGFRYLPIWGLLMDVYRGQCGTEGKGSKACNNFQRAVNLQAAYEGYLAFKCNKNATTGGMFIQGMVAGVPNGNGIYYYTCKQTKAGCRTDDDCTGASGDDSPYWFGGDWVASFCEGATCIKAEQIPGSTQYRSVQKYSEPNKDKSNSDVLENASCRNDATATCDSGWGGGMPERDIWDQATGQSGSGSFVSGQSVQTASAGPLVMASNDPGAPGEVFTLTVLVKDRPAYSKSEAIKQYKSSEKERRNPHLDGVVHVVSSDVGKTIDCGGRCTGKYSKGQEVTLQSMPAVANEKFDGWSANVCANGQKGKRRICVIKMDSNKTIEAYFR